MEESQKPLMGIVAGICAWLLPVQPLICCAFVFITIDFVTGVLASRKRARRTNLHWGFESAKAWKTLYKIVFVVVGIVMTWTIDTYILTFARLNLANLFTGFVCGVELWSYLENAAEISEHPVFRWLKKFMKRKIDKELENL